MSWMGSKSAGAPRAGIVSVLDVGSSKVCCIIAKLKPAEENQVLRGRTHQAHVIGIGHQKARGVKSGVIVDLNKAEQAIRQAVDAAERMAGLTVDSLLVNITSTKLRSDRFSATINLGGHEVDDADIKRVLAAGGKQSQGADRKIIHALPTGFALDGEKGIRDPRGMVGSTLGVDMHVLSGETAPLRNLEMCVNRSHLSVERMVATPYASGLAALVDDEIEMGAVCIDMGGGTTTLSFFADGKFVYADAISIGGGHVTSDLARGLSTRMDAAERLKVMHGSVLPGTTDDRDVITVQPMGADEGEIPQQIPRAIMNRIIKARIDETLEIVRDRIGRSGLGGAVGKRVVLTGGASQLAGLTEAARRVLGRNVRVGRPLGVSKLPEAAKGPAFSAAVGLLVYPQVSGLESVRGASSHHGRMTGTGGTFQRMGQWLRDSF